MTDTQPGDDERKWPHPDTRDEEEVLHADRDLTRRELSDTIDALTHKADLASQSQQVAHNYITKAQDGAATVGGYVRRGREACAESKWLSSAVLAGAAVVVTSVLALARARYRAHRTG